LVVANNEYRIHTSRIRRIRRYFPYLVFALLTIYVFYIAPGFVALFIDEILPLLSSQSAVTMMQVMLFMVFIYFIIIPITQTLREVQTKQLEIFLAAPIRPSDVLIGEFLGQIPLYTIFITVVIGFFTALLRPFGLDLLQTTIIIVVFVVTILSAIWVGTLIAALLRTKLGRTARGRDVGRALAMVIALPLVAMYYSIQFGGLLEMLTDPSGSGIIKTFLNLLPSSWGAELIVYFIQQPSNISAVLFETVTRLIGLHSFLFGSIWLGSKAANRLYSLEPISFIAPKTKSDGYFYKSIGFLGGGKSLGTVLVSIFKDYSRRLENLTNITYILGVIFLMAIFIMPTISEDPGDVPVALMMPQFIFPVFVVMVTGDVTVQGRENLFIYRKVPSGETKLVFSTLLKGWIITLPIAGLVTLIMTFLNSEMSTLSLLNLGLMILYVGGDVVYVLGLFLLNPVFSEKSVRLWVNVMISIFSSIGLFAISMVIITIGGFSSEPFGGLLPLQVIQTALIWIIGSILLFFGTWKLKRIE
jgi:hypothetical protein